MTSISRKRIGDILLQENLVSRKQLEKGIALQEIKNKKLGEILVEEGYISEEDLFRALELHTRIPRINLNAFANKESAKLLPEYLVRKHKVFPIKNDGNVITVALSDPLNVFVVDDIKIVTGLDVQLVMAPRTQIERAINNFYSEILEEPFDSRRGEMGKKNTIMSSEVKAVGKVPSVDLVDMLIEQAIRQGASDIHIEPQQDSLRVRFRLDGVLSEVANLSLDLLLPIIQRIKVTASLDITHKRIPQDGHMKFTMDQRNIDIRVSTMPTVNGEKAVLRILNDDFSMNLEQLGFNGHQLEQIDRMIRCPFGVILVTGSVGSGKTTTLYSMLKVINTPSKNIITLEEPVEHTIPGINQIQINPKAGLTYVTGIRSILRQDPNIIMVGEIRDPDTAGMVIRAALSGHLVFSTLHTNRAAGTVSRLLDMGVEPYLLASCLVGVISQTLVRKICPHCKVAYLPSQEEKECLGLVRHNSTFWRGKGCELCNYTGFKGRIAVGEIIRISDAYRELIMKRATPREIDRVSQKLGVFGLKESGVELVREGITTTDEILRVVYYEN